MDRKTKIEELERNIQALKQYSPSEYMFGFDRDKTTEALRPFFSHPKGLTDRTTIDLNMYGGMDRTYVIISPNDNTQPFKHVEVPDMTDAQLEAVTSLVRSHVVKACTENLLAGSNPSLKDVLPVFEKWAQKCVAAMGKDYKATADFGKRASDGTMEPYHAIVIEKDGWQIGTIPLRQYEHGSIGHNVQIPMAGQWYRDRALPMDNCFPLLRKAIESIVGKHITVSSMPERLELQQTIADRSQKKLDSLLGVRVQTQRYNSWLPMGPLNRDVFENWRLDFEHHFESADKAHVTLVARQMDGKHRDRIELASGTVYPRDPTQPVILTAVADDFPEIFEALVQSEKANVTEAYTERYQDYPGEEIEQFNFRKLDVTGLYHRYIQLRNAPHLCSPVSGLVVVQKPMSPDRWLIAKVAGVYDIADKISSASDARHLNYAAQTPLYGFIMQEAAQKKFTAEIKNLNEAMRRLTEVSCRNVQNGYISGPHIRCRIDGEQQMSISIGHELMDKCNQAPDPELAWHQLAALFYNKELSQNREQGRGMKI